MTPEEIKAAGELMIKYANDPSTKIQGRNRDIPGQWHSINKTWNWFDYEYREEPKPREWWGSIRRSHDEPGFCGALWEHRTQAQRMIDTGCCSGKVVRVREVLE